MKTISILLASLTIGICSCTEKPAAVQQDPWVTNAIDVASYQLKQTASELNDSTLLPRSLWTGYTLDFLVSQLQRDPSTFKDSLLANPSADKLGKIRLCGIRDWTSGFFPGSYGTHTS